MNENNRTTTTNANQSRPLIKRAKGVQRTSENANTSFELAIKSFEIS